MTAGTAGTAGATGTAVADGREHRLDPRALELDRRIAALVGIAVGGPGLLAAPVVLLLEGLWQGLGIGVAAAAAGAALCGLLRLAAELHHRHARYRVDAEGIRIKTGAWWRHEMLVTRSRVQHTDVSQGPLERRCGLGTLVLYTAGREHAKVELSGLPHERALAIRDHLSPRGESDGV